MYWKYMITFYFLWLHHMTFLESKWNNFETVQKFLKPFEANMNTKSTFVRNVHVY